MSTLAPDTETPQPAPAGAKAKAKAADAFAEHQAAATQERDAGDRLAHVHGRTELHAALLALLLPRGSRRALRAWQIEAGSTAQVDLLRRHAAQLSGAARLPWFERLLARMRTQPLAARQALLQATRRVMAARGTARAIDRLHWLTMRRGLGELPPLAARPEVRPVDDDAAAHAWLESDVLAIAVYTAFLSRMIPDGRSAEDGARWYGAAMTSWHSTATLEVPPCRPPAADAMVEALGRLQTLSWMQRPQVVRAWMGAALLQAEGLRGGRLSDLAADALAMSCGLLDTPLPPDLSRHYIVIPADSR